MVKEPKRVSRVIELRVVVFPRRGMLRGICLETDIAVEARSVPELKHKFEDALGLYFESFSSEELARGAYLRPAPAIYRASWAIRFLPHVIRRWKTALVSVLTAQYDPQSNQVELCSA